MSVILRRYLAWGIASAALAAAARAEAPGEACVNCHKGWPELKLFCVRYFLFNNV